MAWQNLPRTGDGPSAHEERRRPRRPPIPSCRPSKLLGRGVWRLQGHQAIGIARGAWWARSERRAALGGAAASHRSAPAEAGAVAPMFRTMLPSDAGRAIGLPALGREPFSMSWLVWSCSEPLSGVRRSTGARRAGRQFNARLQTPRRASCPLISLIQDADHASWYMELMRKVIRDARAARPRADDHAGSG